MIMNAWTQEMLESRYGHVGAQIGLDGSCLDELATRVILPLEKTIQKAGLKIVYRSSLGDPHSIEEALSRILIEADAKYIVEVERLPVNIEHEMEGILSGYLSMEKLLLNQVTGLRANFRVDAYVDGPGAGYFFDGSDPVAWAAVNFEGAKRVAIFVDGYGQQATAFDAQLLADRLLDGFRCSDSSHYPDGLPRGAMVRSDTGITRNQKKALEGVLPQEYRPGQIWVRNVGCSGPLRFRPASDERISDAIGFPEIETKGGDHLLFLYQDYGPLSDIPMIHQQICSIVQTP